MFSCRKQRSEEKEVEQGLKHDINSQQQEAHTALQQREMAVKRYQALQDRHEKASEKQKTLVKELGQWAQRTEDLRAQIVTSPEKLRAVRYGYIC